MASRWTSWAVVAAGLVVLAPTACDNPTGGVLNPGEIGSECATDRDCIEPFVCHDERNVCTECNRSSECEGDAVCLGGTCQPTCGSDDECAAPFRCNPDLGYCVQCLEDAHCEDGDTCSAEGVCVGDGGGTGGNAGAPGTGGSGTGGSGGGTGGSGGTSGGGTPTVVFLVDRTDSMGDEEDPFGDGGETRWEVVVAALLGADGPIQTHGSSVPIGLYTYTAEEDTSCPDVTGVDPDLDNFDAINTYLGGAMLPADKGETPTGAALSNVASSIASEAGPRYIIVLTDGDPDTCSMPDPQCGQDETFVAAQSAYADGTTTLVVGIDDDEEVLTDKFLQDFANAGVGQAVAMPASEYLDECSMEMEPVLDANYGAVGGSAEFYRPSATELAGELTAIVAGIAGG